MGAIRITQFGGIIPRTSERLIPDNAAQIAINCRLSSGELEPFNTGAKVYSSAKTGPLLAIHRIEDGGSYAWLAWPYDVDVVKTTLYGTGRWCYTGDGEPRITTVADAIAGSGDDYPHTAYTLGTPKPVTAPTVNTSGGASATMVDRYYAYTFYAAWDTVEFEGAVSPISTLKNGKVDATWAITGMDASPPSSGTVTGANAPADMPVAEANNLRGQLVTSLKHLQSLGLLDQALAPLPPELVTRVLGDSVQQLKGLH